MAFYSLAVEGTKRKLRNSYLRGKDILCWNCSNLEVYSTAMVEKFNPGIRI